MKKSTSSDQSGKVEGKSLEKKQKFRMKILCCKRASLIPRHHISTFKHFKERIDGLKPRKEQAVPQSKEIDTSGSLPVYERRDHGLGPEVILISGRRKNFMLYEVISILVEEGAGAVRAIFSLMGDKIFSTLHAECLALILLFVMELVTLCRVGVETTRTYVRMKEFIY
ncbi:hypothetical protein ACJRO7_008463 [Eucalyptus globulus]|uniref:Uncharacterized protein n=1 Tax=Eucalyptus globulus TaxID=34317 RepID=A0ABD3IS09_EUCGL